MRRHRDLQRPVDREQREDQIGGDGGVEADSRRSGACEVERPAIIRHASRASGGCRSGPPHRAMSSTQEQHGHRRGVALVQRLEGVDVDVDRDRAGGAGRPAFGHDEDQIGEGGDPDRAQHHGDGDGRREERQRHLGEALPGRGAVDRGGLMQFRRDRLQRRQQRDGEERNAEPDIGDDRPPHGGGRIGQDVGRLGLAGRARRANAAAAR